MGQDRNSVSALAKNAQGSVLAMGAVGFLLTAVLVGGGVDMSRAYKAKSRLQAACDAGVLAGRRTVTTNGFDDTAEGQANSYFATNYDGVRQGTYNTSFVATSDDDGQTIVGAASTTIDTVIMKIVGFDDMSISVACTASMGVGNSDITMVLDTTGSMGWTADGDTSPDPGETTRLEDLQVAMKNFYDTVDAAMSASNARVRYAMVPYSSSVNVGQLISDLDEDYLVSTYNIQSRAWYRWGSPTTTGTDTSTGSTTYSNNWTRIKNPSYNNKSSCEANMPADTAWSNYGGPYNSSSYTINDQGQKVTVSSSNQQQRATTYSCRPKSSRWSTKYYVNYKYKYQTISSETTTVQDPEFEYSDKDASVDGLMYRQVQFDTSDYKNFDTVTTLTGSHYGSPSWVSSTWGGCIEERQTTAASSFSFVPGTGITPVTAFDLDIDSAPDTSDDATKWAPMWPEVAYYRDADEIFSDSGTSASSYCPHAAHLMAEWDKDDFDDYADALSDNGSTYHDIGLLWGARLSSPQGMWADLINAAPGNGSTVSRHLIFMTDGELSPSTTVQSSYGMERNDQRITDNGSTDQWSRHRSRFLAICEAVKDKGIRLWAIAFGTSLSADLTTCASANSAFAASNAAQLNARFQEIAKQVGELRVTQ